MVGRVEAGLPLVIQCHFNEAQTGQIGKHRIEPWGEKKNPFSGWSDLGVGRGRKAGGLPLSCSANHDGGK